MALDTFKPALIIVDLQEDFCPPNGALAVPNVRDIIAFVNQLLKLPFTIKVATKDWHPTDHISFAANHLDKKPFIDVTTITNPANENEKYESRLWPVHCVQNTPGAELVPELHVDKIDRIVEKGTRKEVEMYSAFYDPLVSPRCSDSGLASLLRENEITDCFVVGLAFDYCVKATALDSAKEGFKTWVVGEATRAVDATVWEEVVVELKAGGVQVVELSGEEVEKVRSL
ncbi:hypothetical protein HYALB_00002541 [Hymenoscyphus albidus]|uniref:nicotinamidase n=1 Tax=Hymenoscyphus albidus TaxID=595503 RepID=A0A9N9LY19_9HELO|nr:hypothetical protein HYALB_00002541 [Hymenoscyphus albidus]